MNINEIRTKAETMKVPAYISENKSVNEFIENIPYLKNEGINEEGRGGYNGSATDENGGVVSAFLSSKGTIVDFGRTTKDLIKENKLTIAKWDKNNDGQENFIIGHGSSESCWVTTEVKNDENKNGNFETICGYTTNGLIKFEKYDVDDDGNIDILYNYEDNSTIETIYDYLEDGSVATITTTTDENDEVVKIEKDVDGDNEIEYITEKNKKGELVEKDKRTILKKLKDLFN